VPRRRIQSWPPREARVLARQGNGFAEVAGLDPSSAGEDATIGDAHDRAHPHQQRNRGNPDRATVVSIGARTSAAMGATTAADTITHSDGPSRS